MTMTRTQAAEAGLVHYHGRPCPKCGGTLRYVSCAVCVPCNTQAAKMRSESLRKVIKEARKR